MATIENVKTPGVGLIVKRIRKRRKESMADMGNKLGVTYPYISKIEAGERNPKWLLERISKSYLLTPLEKKLLDNACKKAADEPNKVMFNAATNDAKILLDTLATNINVLSAADMRYITNEINALALSHKR